MKKPLPEPIISILKYVLPLLPAVWLAAAALTGQLSANPIQRLEQRTGDIALILLLLSLACTPLRSSTGWTAFSKFRKPWGLVAFLYAGLHVLLFMGLDYGWSWTSIFDVIREKQFLWPGLVSFLILLVLSITSIDQVKKLIPRWWKRIHYLAYAAGVLVLVHTLLSIKGGLSALRGNYTWPVLGLTLLTLLFLVRIRFVREIFNRLCGKIQP